MNCGGFSPGASFFGTKPSGSAAPPVGAGAAALDEVGVAEAGLEAAGAELDAAELDGAELDGAAVTKLVTVASSALELLLQAATVKSAKTPTAATSFRPRPARIDPPAKTATGCPGSRDIVVTVL